MKVTWNYLQLSQFEVSQFCLTNSYDMVLSQNVNPQNPWSETSYFPDDSTAISMGIYNFQTHLPWFPCCSTSLDSTQCSVAQRRAAPLCSLEVHCSRQRACFGSADALLAPASRKQKQRLRLWHCLKHLETRVVQSGKNRLLTGWWPQIGALHNANVDIWTRALTWRSTAGGASGARSTPASGRAQR